MDGSGRGCATDAAAPSVAALELATSSGTAFVKAGDTVTFTLTASEPVRPLASATIFERTASGAAGGGWAVSTSAVLANPHWSDADFGGDAFAPVPAPWSGAAVTREFPGSCGICNGDPLPGTATDYAIFSSSTAMFGSQFLGLSPVARTDSCGWTRTAPAPAAETIATFQATWWCKSGRLWTTPT